MDDAIELKSTRPLFLISIDVKSTYDLLIKANVGDIIKYEEIEALLGRSVRGEKGAWILSSARRRAFTQNSMLFGTISKVGVKRLDDREIVDSTHDALTRIHRASLKAARRLTAIRDFDALGTSYQTKHNTNASALALLVYVTKESQLKKIEDKVAKSLRTLPLQKTLDSFRE
jgi:hypothetical protein